MKFFLILKVSESDYFSESTEEEEEEESEDDEESEEKMTPEKIAPMCVFLLSDVAEGVTGQIFGVRNNEIFLMGQSRPLRSVHRGEGWTPKTVAEHAIPAMKSHFYPLDRSEDIFSWDPI